ncbi:MAG: hypothetical protein L6Q76_22785 [Polyangiaceae bacterium]|nr:hypothetical protein [Polyangiaceae bacterium]
MAAPQPHTTRVDEQLSDPDAAGRLGSVLRVAKAARVGSPVRATILRGVKTIEAMALVLMNEPRARMRLAAAQRHFKPWTAT